MYFCALSCRLLKITHKHFPKKIFFLYFIFQFTCCECAAGDFLASAPPPPSDAASAAFALAPEEEEEEALAATAEAFSFRKCVRSFLSSFFFIDSARLEGTNRSRPVSFLKNCQKESNNYQMKKIKKQEGPDTDSTKNLLFFLFYLLNNH